MEETKQTMPRLNLSHYSPTWGSHLPVLNKLFNTTMGPILELGIGVFSTPFLHIMCESQNRKLVSYDDNADFVNSHRGFVSKTHELHYVKPDDWDDTTFDESDWDIVLVDHPSYRRYIDIKRLATKANFIVVHDTEPERRSDYDYDSISKLFLYKTDYTKLKPNTSIFSNFINITNLQI